MELGKDNTVQLETSKTLTEDIAFLANVIIRERESQDKEHGDIERLLCRLEHAQKEMKRVIEDLQTKQDQTDRNVKTLALEVGCIKETVRSHGKVMLYSRTSSTTAGTSLISRYKQQLTEFHRDQLKRLLAQQPTLHDVSKYIQLSMSVRRDNYGGCRMAEITPENLFHKQQGDLEEHPRTVVIVGAPGSGKTLLCCHFLDKTIEQVTFCPSVKFSFFLQFRDINVLDNDMSFKSLVLDRHGPSISGDDFEQMWECIRQHEKEVLFILDGFDESEGLGANFQKKNTEMFTSTDHPNKPQVLLYNLIIGNILKEAKVLVTTRPQCVDKLQCAAWKKRFVTIKQLDQTRINQMIRRYTSERPTLCESTVKYVKENEAIRGACSVPINCKGFLDYVNFVHKDAGDTCLNEKEMPQSLAALFLVLVIKMFQTSDRPLQYSEDMTSPEEILERRNGVIQSLAKLAYSGLKGKFKQIFTEKDIKDVHLKAEEIETSIMTCHTVSVIGAMGMERKKFFTFPHFTNQEYLAALHLTQVSCATHTFKKGPL